MISIRKAVIIKNAAGEFLARIIKDENCVSSCKGCGMCGKKDIESEIYPIINAVGLIEGTIVEVEVDSPSKTVAALLLFGLPLVLMFVGGIIGNTYWADTGFIVGGVAGVVVGFMSLWLLGKRFFIITCKIIK